MNETQSQQRIPPTSAVTVPEPVEGKACPIRNPWIRRLGFLGFMFFFIKGLLWLAVPGALVALGTCRGEPAPQTEATAP
jgi:hypothetical protein